MRRRLTPPAGLWRPASLRRRALPSILCAVLLTALSGRQAAGAAQGFYQVARRQGICWLVAPDGSPMFSLGVDCVDPGAARDRYRADRPEYAAFRHYPDDTAWAQATLARLRAWGFNTLGAWCDVEALEKAPDTTMSYSLVLHLGGASGVPWSDLFAADLARKFDALARAQIEPVRDDPRLLGYFTDNELGWWGDTLFLYFLKQPERNATRHRLMALLRDHYQNDYSRLRRDFDPGSARSFADLDRHAALTLRRSGRGMEVVQAFVSLCAQRYYQVAAASIRRYDPNHLILGDRYAGYCPPEVALAAGRYLDVVSTNYGADWNDGGNARFFLDMLHQVTGRPVLITEFYFCAAENRSGDKNTSAGFPTVPTQRERAAGFRANLTAFAALPYVVGAHWFQYYDEPSAGRDDGENYDMGLVDLEDRPYEEMIAAVSDLSVARIHRTAEPSPAPGTPRAPQDPLEGLRRWDRLRAFVPAVAAVPFADLYACWDEKRLYLGVYAAEYADAGLYPGGRIPADERMTLTVRCGGAPLRVRFGPGGPAIVEGHSVPCRSQDRATRFTALVAIPVALLGRAGLRPGSDVDLQAELTSHGRGHRMTWHRTLHLSQ